MDPGLIVVAVTAIGSVASLVLLAIARKDAATNRRAEFSLNVGWRLLREERKRHELAIAGLEARTRQLGPIEKMNALVEVYRTKDDERRLQNEALRAIAVQATALVSAWNAIGGSDEGLVPHVHVANLRKAIGANLWLARAPENTDGKLFAAPSQTWDDDPTPPEAA